MILVLVILSLALLGGWFLVSRFGNATIPEPRNVQPQISLFNEVTENSTSQATKILFGGDLMFDRHIRQRMAEHGVDFVLQPLASTLAEYDLVVANLEGPVTTNPSRSVNSVVGSTNNFIFTFDPAVAPMMRKFNLTVLNLGNNHILNFGEDGVTQTKDILEANQLLYFGDTQTEASSQERVLLQEVNGMTLGFVNYNQFVTGGYEHALADLAWAEERADLTVVYPHWGLEYEVLATGVIVDQAHQFIDQGADLVIGGHPHVVQQQEEYQGKKIYYSLGNFVFDQYFSPETQQGMLVSVEIMPDLSLEYQEIPILTQKGGQTRKVEP